MFTALTPYAMRIAAAIIMLLAIISGYLYWKHEVQVEQHEKDMAALAKRDKGEREQSEKLMNEAIANVTRARQDDQNNYDRTLKAYAQIISDRKPITIVGVRDKSTGTKSNNCPATGQTDVPEGSSGTYGEIGEEIPELAELCLLAAEEIRRTHEVK